MSFMDILKEDKDDKKKPTKMEQEIEDFKNILERKEDILSNKTSTREREEALLRNYSKALNDYFLDRDSRIPSPFMDLIEENRVNNQIKLYKLFKKIGIRFKNKFATQMLTQKAFTEYINFDYDSRLEEVKPIIEKIMGGKPNLSNDEIALLFSKKNKLLVLELIERIVLLEDDVGGENTVMEGKNNRVLQEVIDKIENNVKIISYLNAALELVDSSVSENALLRLNKDLDKINQLSNTEEIKLEELDGSTKELLADIYENLPKDRVMGRKGRIETVKERQRQEERMEQYGKDTEKYRIDDLKQIDELERTFNLYEDKREKVFTNIIDNVKDEEVSKHFEKVSRKLDGFENDIEKLNRELVKKRDKYKELIDKDVDFEEKESAMKEVFEKRDELGNVTKKYIDLFNKTMYQFRTRTGGDKAEYSQRTKFKETKPKVTTKDINPKTKDGKFATTDPYDSGDYESFSGEYNLPRRVLKDIQEVMEEGKRILSKLKIKPTELDSFIPKKEYTIMSGKDKGKRKKKYQSKSKITPEEARYLYGGITSSKKKKDKK